jgi:hypothetical protein
MKLTPRQLRKWILEEISSSTKKYDNDSALVGGQSKLSDPLQKAIIDKTVEDREEAKEKEAKEKSESIRITKTQLQQIIKEEGYYADLPKEHIDGQAWEGSLADLAYHQGRTWGHGNVVDQKGFKNQIKKSERLAQGKDASPLFMTEGQLRRIIRETIEAVDVDTGEVWDNEDGSVPDEAWPDLVRRLGIEIERQDPDGTYYIDDISKLFDEVQGKRDDRAATAKAKRLQIDTLLARVDQWAADAGADFLADNPDADMQGVARDLARSIEYEFDDDEWNELTWHFDEEAWEISPQEDGTEMLFTYVADRLAG